MSIVFGSNGQMHMIPGRWVPCDICKKNKTYKEIVFVDFTNPNFEGIAVVFICFDCIGESVSRRRKLMAKAN